MADGTAAAGPFWLRSKVQGTGRLMTSLAANTGVALAGNRTDAKSLAGKLLPDDSILRQSETQTNKQPN